jgi:hypothetical protein
MNMKKSVIDLQPQEVEKLASEAWKSAAEEALAAGRSITGSRDGRRFRYYPDGRIVDLGPVEELPDQNPQDVDAYKKSVA